jgi:hypothetical protein
MTTVVRYGICVGKKQAVIGFRTPNPPSGPPSGQGKNIVGDGEVRVAPCLLATLGIPSPLQYTWVSHASAEYISRRIKHARVVEVVEVKVRQPTRGGKEMGMGAKKQRKTSGRTAGGRKTATTAKKPKKSKPRRHRCKVCGKLGHDSRSHAPGGRLADGTRKA